MLKKFTKSEVAAMLTAAGMTLEQVQAKASDALQAKVQDTTSTIESNKRVIAEAQEEINSATLELKTAKATLQVVQAMGG